MSFLGCPCWEDVLVIEGQGQNPVWAAFSPVHCGYRCPVSGSRSQILVPRCWKKSLSVESELYLFPPCMFSLSSQQWYLWLRGSNTGTGEFLWARHTAETVRKPVRLQTAPDPPPPQKCQHWPNSPYSDAVLGWHLPHTLKCALLLGSNTKTKNSPAPFVPYSVDLFIALVLNITLTISSLFSVRRGPYRCIFYMFLSGRCTQRPTSPTFFSVWDFMSMQGCFGI